MAPTFSQKKITYNNKMNKKESKFFQLWSHTSI